MKRAGLLLALLLAGPVLAQSPSTAFGHEPGWRAQLGERQLDFQADDGKRFALDVDARPKPGAPLQLGLQVQGEPLLLRAEVALCHDTRSGLPYPWRLSLTLAGRVYLGCGGHPALLLQGEAWRLKNESGQDESGQTLRFDTDGSFHAQTGCNLLRGRYTADDSGLTLKTGPMTRRACWGAAATQAEERLLAALPQVLRFDIDEQGRLLLRSLDGSQLRLSRAQPSS